MKDTWHSVVHTVSFQYRLAIIILPNQYLVQLPSAVKINHNLLLMIYDLCSWIISLILLIYFCFAKDSLLFPWVNHTDAFVVLYMPLSDLQALRQSPSLFSTLYSFSSRWHLPNHRSRFNSGVFQLTFHGFPF